MGLKYLATPTLLLLAACASAGGTNLPSQTGQADTTQAVNQRCDPIAPYRKSDGTIQYWSCDPQPLCERVTTYDWTGNYIGSSTQTVASFGLYYRHTPMPLPPDVVGSSRANAIQQTVRTLRGRPLVQGESYERRQQTECNDSFRSTGS